jgi:hypothetical protein
MTELKYTPGPWEAIKGVIDSDEMRCAVVAVRSENSYLVATIENGAPGDFCDTEYVNAKLIASAPDLLLALAAIDDLCSEEILVRKPSKASEIYSLLALPRNIARAAIAKATGQ